MSGLQAWLAGVQLWALTWVRTHVIEAQPIVYLRPGRPALWRATWWRAEREYTVQFYRNGQCLGTGRDPMPYWAYRAARRDARKNLAVARARFDTGRKPTWPVA